MSGEHEIPEGGRGGFVELGHGICKSKGRFIPRGPQVTGWARTWSEGRLGDEGTGGRAKSGRGVETGKSGRARFPERNWEIGSVVVLDGRNRFRVEK